MIGRRHLHILYALSLAFQSILGFVRQLPNSITQPSQPSLPAPDGIYVGVSPEAPLPFKVEYRYSQGGKTFDRVAFMNTMIRSMGSMTKWRWESQIPSTLFLPSGYGVSMKFLPLRTGSGLMTKHIAWTIEEIFDIVLEHDRYSVGNFQVNANWDDDTIAFGSLALTSSTLALSNVNDTLPSAIGPDVESQILSADERTPNTALSVATKEDSHLDAKDGVKLLLTYVEGGPIYRDSQIYNATLKALMHVVANVEPMPPLIATYNDLDNFTLSVRSLSVKKELELSLYWAGQALAWFPMSTERWIKQMGVISIGGKARGVLCVDPGDQRDFERGNRCEPDLDGG